MSSMRTFELKVISLSDKTRKQLDNFAERFNLALRHLYAEDCREHNQLTKIKHKSSYQSLFNLNARHYNSVYDTLKGMTSSAVECAKLHLEDIRLKIENNKRDIKNLETKKKKSEEYLKNNFKALKSSLKPVVFTKKDEKRLCLLKQKLARLKDKIVPLMIQVAEHKPKLCFGSKKLFREQFNNQEHNHKEWLKRWHNARNSNFVFIGSKDESHGNLNAQLTHNPTKKDPDLYHLNVNLKDTKVLIKVHIPYGDYLRQAVLNNEQRTGPDKQALTVRFKRDWINKTYQIWVSLDVEKQPVAVVSTKQTGMIGVDFNIDHLAVTNVDYLGNIKEVFNIKLCLYGKSSDQACDIIGSAVKKLIQYAKAHNKPIVIEDLDFAKKKRELAKEDCSKKYKRMLSSFAYSRIQQTIRARGYDNGIEVIAVNPAYTSKIGEAKYQERYGLTVHQSPAMVIARRGMNLRERHVTPYKGGLRSAVVPARNQQKRKVNYWVDAVRVKRAHVEQCLVRRPRTRINDFYFGSSKLDPCVVV